MLLSCLEKRERERERESYLEKNFQQEMDHLLLDNNNVPRIITSWSLTGYISAGRGKEGGVRVQGANTKSSGETEST